MLGVLIIVHELGHYFVGRLLKLPVVEFSVGFGPLLIGRERNGIQYSLRALPFGGYCAFDDEEADGRPSFMQSPAWKRLVTFIAGPAMNLVLAYVMVVVLLAGVGVPLVNNVIAALEPGEPAEAAGLAVGDEIMGVDGVMSDDPVPLIQQSSGRIVLTVERDGALIDIPVDTIYDEARGINRIGITRGSTYQPYSLWDSIRYGGQYCYQVMAQMLGFLRDLVLGRQDPGEVAGIVGTVTLISTQTQAGFAESFRSGMYSFLNLALLLSLNLGIMNLLPLPALDGGHIVFSLIEMIARRPVPRKIQGIINTVGMVALFGLMIVLVIKDVIGLATGTLPI